MIKKYKDQKMNMLFNGYIEYYKNGGLPLFLPDGSKNRGASSRCAFWDGFDGVTNQHHPGMMKAVYAAGKYCKTI